MQELSLLIDQSAMDNLSRRSPKFLMWSFPFHFLAAVVKDIKNIRQYLRFFVLFYKLNPDFAQELVFTHRDLHPGNIIINGNQIAIIDFEIAALAEPETDLAIAVKFYAKKIGPDLTKKLIFDFAPDKKSRRTFLRLTIFYTLQLLAIEDSKRELYKDAQSYLTILEKDIIPNLFT